MHFLVGYKIIHTKNCYKVKKNMINKKLGITEETSLLYDEYTTNALISSKSPQKDRHPHVRKELPQSNLH